ncbi:hypothetical protein G647_09112 [Cladophialophora carrionii CBS 160.54]|uniref:non-specific serine/threonine protein kinase n=1 Tax=Cladophialophora carrionii CBS 160.54 TaxID=1279043 RepID=V9CXB8_9EURO|nr:uncharacterized protein G647_09112 [Cladophialophora carrionii CBS 160.54]ETI19280.1 hypothetical protein G647_09112 [Cladophialophora carrionii CBS 160.54]
MYECLYGYTPFACDDRHQTKLKILSHKKTLIFPQPQDVPEPSIEALDLMMSILVEKEKRLCSRQYQFNDYCRKIQDGKMVRQDADKTHQDYQGQFVYDGDAEDIKRHAFFRGIDWDTMHLRRPPYIPRVKGWEDTKYFQEEEPISDIDTATTVEEARPPTAMENAVQPSKSKSTQASQHQQEGQHIVPSMGLKVAPHQDVPVPDADLQPVRGLKNPLLPAIVNGAPSTGATLVEIGGHVDPPPENGAMENTKPKPKRKEKKRPRDIILRDPVTGPPALEMRKLGAILGYEYRHPVTAKEIVEQILSEDLAKAKYKDHRPGGDGQDLDLSFERRVYVDSGGHMTPHHRPVQQMLRCEHNIFGV